MARKPLRTIEQKVKRKLWANERRTWKKWGKLLFADEKIW